MHYGVKKVSRPLPTDQIGPVVLRPRCACIEDSVVVRKILNHLQEKSPLDSGIRIANPRAPPPASLFG
jgi:hypothetical protein